MKEKKICFARSIFKSFIPLLTGTTCHLLKGLFLTLGSSQKIHNILDSSQVTHILSEAHHNNGFNFTVDLLSWISHMSFGIYANFFAFLFMMILIDLLSEILKQKSLTRGFASISLNKKDFESKLGTKSPGQRIGIFMRILCYGLIFIMIQVTAGLSKNFYSGKDIESLFTPANIAHPHEEDNFNSMMSARILEEIPPRLPSLMKSEKISLSMGRVIGSTDIEVTSMILSRDRKVAFATLRYYGTLKIIDLSDEQNPSILGSLDLKVSGENFRLKTVILSSDEKTLYISNSEYLEIVDVSHLKSPRLISCTPSSIFNRTILDEISDYFKTSLALDEKTKTLYIGGLGLQVYNVSDMKNPVLLRAYKNDLQELDYFPFFNREMLRWNEICLSHDGEVLWMVNGTLDVYNISDPQNMELINSFSMGSDVRSIYLSEEDPQIAFLLGGIENKERILEKVDISDYSLAPKVLESNSFEYLGSSGLRIIATSPGGTKVYIFIDDGNEDFSLSVFDTSRKELVSNEKNLIGDTYTMSFSHDGRTLITGSNDQLLMVEMFLDYPNSQIFGSIPNIISEAFLEYAFGDLKLSTDGKFLFMKSSVNGTWDGDYKTFEIWDVNNPFKTFSSFRCDEKISQISLANNSNTVYLGTENTISILDISDRANPVLKKTYDFEIETEQIILQIVTTSDGNLGFILFGDKKTSEIAVINLSESEEKKSLLTLDEGCQGRSCKLRLKDDQTLLMFGKEITIFDVSNLDAPLVKLASIRLSSSESERVSIASCLLSPDRNTMYIETVTENGFSKLLIYDISSARSPRLVSEKSFSKLDSSFESRLPFSLNADLKTGFVFEQNSLLKVNLADLRITGVIPLRVPNGFKGAKAVSYILSPDGQTMYVAFESKNIHIINLNIKHTLFLKKEKFLLGERYSDDVPMLEFKSGVYKLMKRNAYKIVKLSLIDIKVSRNKYSPQITTSPLPLWINFDPKRNLVNIEPLKQLGFYTFQAALSLKIPDDIFDKTLEDYNEKSISSEEVLILLMSLGYIDTEMFLTEKFGPYETFKVPSQLSGVMRARIYDLLKEYSVETCTEFEIIPSLELNMEEKDLMISTLSLDNIKIGISLIGNERAKFLNKPYGSLVPVINEFKNRLSLEGTLKEINTALESIVIDCPEENSQKTNAVIVINDALNPLVTKNLTYQEVEKYFKKNKSPKENNKVQDQINRVNIETGQYFTITFAEDTFIDDYSPNSSLTYDFAMPKDNKERLKWITLNKLTLTGTPPEDVLGREIDLVLIARNEFKENRIPFRINIKISSNFALKLVWRYCPYILSIIGLLVSFNKIHNILGKRFYKHPKEYVLDCDGQEINSEVIFPIYFVRQEKYESEIIFKHFMKKKKGQLGLEKYQIIEAIEEIVRDKLSQKQKAKLKYYCSSLDYRKSLIQQLVIDKLNLLMLNREKETKKIFNKIKDKWTDMIYWDSLGSKFALNQSKFEKILDGGVFEKKTSEKESLLNTTKINLLKDCVVAYAFRQHQVNNYPAKVKIEIRQRVDPNFLYRFIKRDLRIISVGVKNRLDFGINCEINRNMLTFSGVTAREMEGETLVLQIWNSRQRILKEIWFYGRRQSLKLNDNLDDTFDFESIKKGLDYEVY